MLQLKFSNPCSLTEQSKDTKNLVSLTLHKMQTKRYRRLVEFQKLINRYMIQTLSNNSHNLFSSKSVVSNLTLVDFYFWQPKTNIPVFDDEHFQLPVSEWKFDFLGKMQVAKDKGM